MGITRKKIVVGAAARNRNSLLGNRCSNTKMLLNTIFNSFIFILGVSPWFLVSSKSILSESEERGESAISPRNPEEENIEKLSRHRRNARSRREYLWRTRTIPYEISYSLRKNKEVIYE